MDVELGEKIYVGDYLVHFYPHVCELKVYHNSSDTEVFHADPSKMVETGQGNENNAPENIIVNGNVKEYPKVEAWSKSGSCPSFTVSQDDNGDNQVVFTGEISAPTSDWAKIDPFGFHTEI